MQLDVAMPQKMQPISPFFSCLLDLPYVVNHIWFNVDQYESALPTGRKINARPVEALYPSSRCIQHSSRMYRSISLSSRIQATSDNMRLTAALHTELMLLASIYY